MCVKSQDQSAGVTDGCRFVSIKNEKIVSRRTVQAACASGVIKIHLLGITHPTARDVNLTL